MRCSIMIIPVLIVTILTGVQAQTRSVESFRLDQVSLLNSPFLDAEQTDLKYMLKLEPDRLLAPFLREAGLQPKAPSYGNWENTGLDGHTAGHYLTALAQMYAATGSPECKKRLDYMVSELGRCQTANANGYVGGVPRGNSMWAKMKKGDLSEFNKEWVPWYNLHKLFAGLRDAWLFEGNQQARAVFFKLTNWAADEVSGLSDLQIQTMLNMEHGGMNEVIADAFALSGDRKYLELAKKFSHRAVLESLEQHQDKLTGLHANTQIPKVIGFERIAELGDDSSYAAAARFFWQDVVNNRSISIGGNSVAEHFNPVNDFSSMLESEQGPETCNSNNMLKLTKMLFLKDGGHQYIDFYERLLYNHILSSQHPGVGGFVYFTPIHPQHYRVYSTASESFWCCVGTGMENHGKYGEIIYTHQRNDIFVNLFIPSVLNWKAQGLKLIQQNKLLSENKTQITVHLQKTKAFTVYIRKPQWVRHNGFAVSVNGQIAPVSPAMQGNYVGVTRRWHNGDKISVQLPMKNYTEYLPDHSDWISFLHGPYVLAAPTDSTDMPGLFANGSRWGHIAGGKLYPLTTSPVLLRTVRVSHLSVTDAYGKSFPLSPFYQVHDTRYLMYWPITAKDSLPEKERQLAKLDENYLKLAPKTIDKVSPGEQQPENDHMLKAENSQTGILLNMHWRSATGYFSYQLRHNPSAKFLRVTYYAKEKDCSFDILLNQAKLAHIVLDGTAKTDFISTEFPLPEASAGSNERFVVTFAATDGQKTAPVTEVRVMRK